MLSASGGVYGDALCLCFAEITASCAQTLNLMVQLR